MAFFDFLGKDIGGYAQGPMPSGHAGVPQTGMTWGNLLQAAMANPFGRMRNSNQLATQWLIDPNKPKKSGMQDAVSILGTLYGFRI
jgi:hypothetical protein